MKKDAIRTLLVSSFVVVSEVMAQTGTPDVSWYSNSVRNITISTADQLAGLAQITNGTAAGRARDNFSGKTVRLMADIDLSAYDNWVPIGNEGSSSSSSVISFYGTLDGKRERIALPVGVRQ